MDTDGSEINGVKSEVKAEEPGDSLFDTETEVKKDGINGAETGPGQGGIADSGADKGEAEGEKEVETEIIGNEKTFNNLSVSPEKAQELARPSERRKIRIKVNQLDKRRSEVKDLYSPELTTCLKCHKTNVRQKEGTHHRIKYCDKCRKEVKQENARNLRRYISKDDKKVYNIAKGPDGMNVFLVDEDEQKFYESRLKKYKKDFDFTESADMTLLSRLLSLEIEARRIEKRLSKGNEITDQQQNHVKIVEQIRRVQQDLGITRHIRLGRERGQDPGAIILGIVQKFKEYYKKRNESPKLSGDDFSTPWLKQN